MRKIIVIFIAVFFSLTMVVGLVSDPARADILTIEEPDLYPSPNSGKVKALIVRVGYEDYPVDDSNEYYTSVNDDMLHLMFEGQEGGIGLPFNGLSDYLYKSSYGAMSMEIGEIVDIQMDGTAESYYTDNINDDGDEFRDPLELLNSNEFKSKLKENVDLKDYDSDNWGGADALYIFDVAGDVWWDAVAQVTVIEGITGNVSQRVAYFRPSMNDSVPILISTIIHETGHLLLKLPDYYKFDNYSYTDDINNVMGLNGEFDYDALSKWGMGWLTNDNVIGIEPDDGETGVIELTPYDSDTPDGKKIAVFKCGLYYIAVDYCGGINNNNISTNLRKKGFRFYIVNKNLEAHEVYFADTEDGTHQLFIEGEDLEDIFGRGLTITDIQTGDNPSFTYTYTHKDSNNIPEVLVDIPTYEINVNYKVSVLDEDGNDITNDIEIDFQDISETERSFDDIRYVEEKKDTLELYFFDFISQVDTKVSLSSVPDGYKESEVVLNLVRSDYGSATITSPNSNVEVIEPENSNVFEIKVTLQKEQQEETVSKSDDTTETSDDEKTDEQITSSEEITNNDNDNAQNKSSNKNGARKTTETVNKTDSGKSTEVAVAKSNDSSAKIESNSVTSENKAPGTGDKNTTPLWITLACAAAGVIGTAIAVIRKKKAD